MENVIADPTTQLGEMPKIYHSYVIDEPLTPASLAKHLLICGYSPKESAVLVVAKEQEKTALAVVRHDAIRTVCEDSVAMIRGVVGLPASIWFLHRFDTVTHPNDPINFVRAP